MRLVLLLVLVAVPLIEISLLIKAGQLLGVWPTLGLVIGTAILGSTVLRWQGLGVLQRASDALDSGRPPIEPVVDGVFLLLAGAFLISPGLLTDLLGLVLLIPPVRRGIARWAFARFLTSGDVHVEIFSRRTRPGSPPRSTPSGDGSVIEGEFERLDETTAGRGPADPDTGRLTRRLPQ